MAQLNHIIIGPVITEKAYGLQEKGYYTFWVNKAANKQQVAMAFLAVYNLPALTVNLFNLKGKVKTDWKRRVPINKQNRKKAIIFIGKDKKIDSLKLNTKWSKLNHY